MESSLGFSGFGGIGLLVSAGIFVNGVEIPFTRAAGDSRTDVHNTHTEGSDVDGQAVSNLASAELDCLAAKMESGNNRNGVREGKARSTPQGPSHTWRARFALPSTKGSKSRFLGRSSRLSSSL